MVWQQFAGAHQFAIGLNAIDVQLVRTTRARQQTGRGHGPGFDPWVAEDLGTFRVRIHQQNRGSGSGQSSDVLTGHQERDTTWGMITGPEVPLRVTDGQDDNVRVMFVHPVHGSFRLRRLRALEGDGGFLGWQSDLERVSHTGPDPSVATTGGRRRLEDDPTHPWRRIADAAEQLRAEGPRLSWDMIAARLDVSRERLDEYRRRAREADDKAGKDPPKPVTARVRVRPGGGS